ncbi:LmbU family transcriptional regulator [Streptomyces lancefieldiae]|uniref:LmbU family transcriptional regulator n=1 Tax=Streptomyces lancefieldiae TaxID=3075520 RepID=A0ABU3B0S3_9ACTN|nr:LmbU family transcriptional regulator [Streptomyces sp. DSM 40712]MDT0616058.1 LmbU family transcriptional regulator [Streptomyces sp. DSM 40712]
MTGDPTTRSHGKKPTSSNLAKREANSIPTFGTSTLVTRRGLTLPKRMEFDKWLGIGNYLSNVISASAWCLGDWLVYGEATFNGRYQDAIQLTALDYQTLRNHAWVARRFPMSRRRDRLSFTHHAEVAALAEPEQDFWLRKAEAHEWSAKRLRREVKASLRERSASDDLDGDTNQTDREIDKKRNTREAAVPSPEDTVSLKLPISADCLEFCRAAASRAGLKLETWAAQILLEAVDQAPAEALHEEQLSGGGLAEDQARPGPARPKDTDDDPRPHQLQATVRGTGRAGHDRVHREVRPVH